MVLPISDIAPWFTLYFTRPKVSPLVPVFPSGLKILGNKRVSGVIFGFLQYDGNYGAVRL